MGSQENDIVFSVLASPQVVSDLNTYPIYIRMSPSRNKGCLLRDVSPSEKHIPSPPHLGPPDKRGRERKKTRHTAPVYPCRGPRPNPSYDRRESINPGPEMKSSILGGYRNCCTFVTACGLRYANKINYSVLAVTR